MRKRRTKPGCAGINTTALAMIIAAAWVHDDETLDAALAPYFDRAELRKLNQLTNTLIDDGFDVLPEDRVLN